VKTRSDSFALAILLGALAGSADSARAQEVGAVPDGGVGATTFDAVSTGATTSGADGSPTPVVPWAGTTDVARPSFLDTTDRRLRDDRPPPTPEQVRALRELEAEVGRFTKAGSSYREAVHSILRREYLQRRRERERGYGRQIQEEERLLNEARERAIRLFERFIQRYPDDPTYTPDAMFRLGELYYERSALAFQEAALAGDTPGSGQPDFTPTVELYRQLIRRFPNYRRIDGVYYLIGYCLNEMGQMAEARLAWLNLVCANRYRYTGEPLSPPTSPIGEAELGLSLIHI